MKKCINYLLVSSMFLMPTLVFADTGDNSLSIQMAIMMEAFVSIHMSIFVLKPLSYIFGKENNKKMFWDLFFIRVIILLFCDFFVTLNIAIFDFIAFFVGAFIVVPLAAKITKTPINTKDNQVIGNNIFHIPSNIQSKNQNTILKCSKCGNELNITDKFCQNCGAHIESNNMTKVLVNSSNFDPMFNNTDDKLLEEFIKRELVKANINSNNKLIPSEVLKRKNILNVIFSILLFVYITLIFFHFPIYTYIIGILILIVFFKITTQYNLIKYLKKEVKSRPSEKISNIVMNAKNSFVKDNFMVLRVGCILISIVIPLVIFINPRIMYEKLDNGYAVRFYAFGLTNFKTATIPETYKGENVISLRGNTFSNMPFLESVSLPDTIIEIRGQAFKNDSRLVSVNIPKKLEYLGGGAFYNCSSITSISLPDTLTYMGGETFYGASSLKTVKLSKNLTEIRGNTFEYCTSLKSIEIPDNIRRIGGHAFYGDTSLFEVIFTENSKLDEIGSSAFRKCTRLHSITIPKGVYVNERAFKESPTSINYFNEYVDDEYWNESNNWGFGL